MRFLLALVSFIIGLQFALGQTSTKCNPLQESCPADKGSLDTALSYDFTNGASLKDWDTLSGNVHTGSDGAEFTINKQGDHPTIQSVFAIFYGEVSIEMKASPGVGIVSSLMMESIDLDEVDWEILGGVSDKLQTDYFGKGDTSTYDRSTWASAASPQTIFHKYTWTWTESQIVWSIDGQVVRTLPYAEAKGGSRFPQTPMYIRLGIWAGGDPSNRPGTITWAGGQTDYSQAPFTMYVKSVHINNYNPAKSYSYSDNSGSSGSIKLDGAGPKNQGSSSSESSFTTTSTITVTTTLSSTTSTLESTVTSVSTDTHSSTDTHPSTHTTASTGTGKSEGTTVDHKSTGTSPQTVITLMSTESKTTYLSFSTLGSNNVDSVALLANHSAAKTSATTVAESSSERPNEKVMTFWKVISIAWFVVALLRVMF